MKKNRIIAGIWIGLLLLILVVTIAYICYASKYHPYFAH